MNTNDNIKNDGAQLQSEQAVRRTRRQWFHGHTRQTENCWRAFCRDIHSEFIWEDAATKDEAKRRLKVAVREKFDMNVRWV